jgi:hypothetical protein
MVLSLRFFFQIDNRNTFFWLIFSYDWFFFNKRTKLGNFILSLSLFSRNNLPSKSMAIESFSSVKLNCFGNTYVLLLLSSTQLATYFDVMEWLFLRLKKWFLFFFLYCFNISKNHVNSLQWFKNSNLSLICIKCSFCDYPCL